MKTLATSTTLGILAFAAAAAGINHGLVGTFLPSGSGLTLDEGINLGQGVYLADAFVHHGPLVFTPQVAQEVFGSERYLSDYPPLGRLLLGLAHNLTAWTISGAEECAMNVAAGRLGSCVAFAVTVVLLTACTARRYGISTAVLCGVSLILMPRVVGHARLASVETVTSLAWLACLLPLFAWWCSDQPPLRRHAMISGMFWGLLMLTKVQAILLPPLVFGWAVWRFRFRAIQPLFWWIASGVVLFFAGWPWLWLNPIDNVTAYFSSASDRVPLYVWYLSHRFLDKAVPWHFSSVMLLATLPVFVLLACTWRLVVCRCPLDRVELLCAASVFWPLIVFAIPGTPVYDGTRLFLVVMPGIALLTGRALCLLGQRIIAAVHSRHQNPKQGVFMRTGSFALPAVVLVSLVTSLPVPLTCAIGSYNLPGVFVQSNSPESPVMESSYWGDALNGDFWMSVPMNSTVFVAPVLHQRQLRDMELLVPIVQERNIRLMAFEYDSRQPRGLTLLVYRLADLRPVLRHIPDGAEVVHEVRSNGAVQARLIDTTNATWNHVADWPEDQR